MVLRGRGDEHPVPAQENPGAVFLHASDGTPVPHFADAHCQEGRLVVELFGTPPRDLASRVLDTVSGPENYHPIEYQLFYLSLRRNASERVAAWHRARPAGGSARPPESSPPPARS